VDSVGQAALTKAIKYTAPMMAKLPAKLTFCAIHATVTLIVICRNVPTK
jgi:hypothetical protein